LAARLNAEMASKASERELADRGPSSSEPPGRVELRGVEQARSMVVEAAAAVEDVPWPDETAESAFLSEAKERGESVPVKRAEEEVETETMKPLPALETLVDRIPQPARDALEDLFRAKFVRVQRVPKKVLKK